MKEGTVINGFADVSAFAGKIVAFNVVNHGYILPQDTEWSKPKGCENLNFGHIRKDITHWRSGEMGYSMAIFKGVNEVPNSCALTDECVREAGLTMREATSEEIQMLREVYDSGKGNFEYVGWPNLE